MKRPNPQDRVDQLVSAAAKVFTSHGYRRTTMADIAHEMGVAPGTLYLYVESKEALFHLLAMRTLVDPDAALPELPVRTPQLGATVAMLKEGAALEDMAPRLMAAQAHPGRGDELRTVIGEIYDSLYERRAGINLIERSAADWPEMAEAFYHGLRQQLIAALTRYLTGSMAAGFVRPLPDAAIAARFILESVAWFAIHRHGDPGPKDFSDEAARDSVVDLLVASVRKV